MIKSLSSLLLILTVWVSPVAVAQPAIVCDSIYMVESGNSLSRIAQRAYGRMSAYQLIFDYNPGVLSNPNKVPVGVGLYIPCMAEQVADAPVALPALPALPQVPTTGALKILTGSDYPPYTDENLPNGGFSVELLERSLLNDDGAADYRVDFINDWASHLSPLLSDGAYDLALPWFQPDCRERDSLGESSQWRCDNLLFSEPLHEVVVSFYARPEVADSLSSAEDMKGLSICRPRGYFTHDLEAMGLVEGSYERAAPTTPTECFEQMMAGEVDIVTVNADTTDKILTKLDIREQAQELLDYANVQTLHVVAMKGDPRARVNLLRLNKGLVSLRRSGDYRKIADTHLR